MNILDENIPASQRQILENRHLRVRQIGYDIGRRGMLDEEIIPLLLQQRKPTFFTRDKDFFDRKLCHLRYCIVYLAIGKDEVADCVRQILRAYPLTEPFGCQHP